MPPTTQCQQLLTSTCIWHLYNHHGTAEQCSKPSFERAAKICDYFIVCSVTVTQFHRILDWSFIQAAEHGFCFPRFKSLRSFGYKTFNRTEISQMGALKARTKKILLLLHLYFFLTSFRSWTRLKMLRTTTSLSSYLVLFDADISCCLPYLKLDLCTHTRTHNWWLGPIQLLVIVLNSLFCRWFYLQEHVLVLIKYIASFFVLIKSINSKFFFLLLQLSRWCWWQKLIGL